MHAHDRDAPLLVGTTLVPRCGSDFEVEAGLGGVAEEGLGVVVELVVSKAAHDMRERM